MDVNKQFDTCVTAIHQSAADAKSSNTAPPIAPTIEEKLRLYSLYKQATLGDCPVSTSPWRWQITAYRKWKAWQMCSGMSHAKAQELYVGAVRKLLEEVDMHKLTVEQKRSVQQLRKVLQ